MKETRVLMGMPVTVEVVDQDVQSADIEKVFDYFQYVDATFSTYKKTSEISRFNAGTLSRAQLSKDMQYVLEQCEQTKQETMGYFDSTHDGILDPSGYVKGWSIQNAAALLANMQFRNYYVEVGGDLQVAGTNSHKKPWVIGIRNPFNRKEIVKRVSLKDKGMATSGSYIRGQHIYNPLNSKDPLEEIVSISVIGPEVVDADRYATAAFAIGKQGIHFIAGLPGFEGYQIDRNGIASFTEGFHLYSTA